MQPDELRNMIALYANIIKTIDNQIESLTRDREKFMKRLIELIDKELIPIVREEIGLKISVDKAENRLILRIDDDLDCVFWDVNYNEIKKFIKNRFPELYDLLL